MTATKDVHITILRKNDGENYCITWSASTATEAFRTIARWAANPELSFSWWDCATVAQRIRNQLYGGG